jgi:hypothetical protein
MSASKSEIPAGMAVRNFSYPPAELRTPLSNLFYLAIPNSFPAPILLTSIRYHPWWPYTGHPHRMAVRRFPHALQYRRHTDACAVPVRDRRPADAVGRADGGTMVVSSLLDLQPVKYGKYSLRNSRRLGGSYDFSNKGAHDHRTHYRCRRFGWRR